MKINSEYIYLSINFISIIITIIAFAINIRLALFKHNEYKRFSKNKQFYKKAFKDFSINNNHIDNSLINIIINETNIRVIINNYITQLINSLNTVYPDYEFSINVWILNKDKTFSNYSLATDTDDSSQNILDGENNIRLVFEDIIENEYNYAYITDYNSCQNLLEHKNNISSFVAYPIKKDKRIIGIISITSNMELKIPKSNRVIANMLNETSKDLYEVLEYKDVFKALSD